MFCLVEDDGQATFTLTYQGYLFGPRGKSLANQAVQQILDDLWNQGLPVETTAMLTRNYTSGDAARVIWRGHLTDVALVPDLREYMKRLAQSYEGR